MPLFGLFINKKNCNILSGYKSISIERADIFLQETASNASVLGAKK